MDHRNSWYLDIEPFVCFPEVHCLEILRVLRRAMACKHPAIITVTVVMERAGAWSWAGNKSKSSVCLSKKWGEPMYRLPFWARLLGLGLLCLPPVYSALRARSPSLSCKNVLTLYKLRFAIIVTHYSRHVICIDTY